MEERFFGEEDSGDGYDERTVEWRSPSQHHHKKATMLRHPRIAESSTPRRQVSHEASDLCEEGSAGRLVYSRKPREVDDFKPYTLKDYERIKPREYFELGSLGADLQTEELKAKVGLCLSYC